MNSPNVSHIFDFQLVRFNVALVMCLFLKKKRRKKGAHTFTAPHGTLRELPDRWKEVPRTKLTDFRRFEGRKILKEFFATFSITYTKCSYDNTKIRIQAIVIYYNHEKSNKNEGFIKYS